MIFIPAKRRKRARLLGMTNSGMPEGMYLMRAGLYHLRRSLSRINRRAPIPGA